MYSDTMFAAAKAGKSVRNFSCVQVFATDFGWCTTYNLDFERNIHTAYKRLFKEVGVPMKLIVDQAKAQVQGEAKKVCDEAGCQIVELEKYTPASNRAERTIQELKMETRRDVRLSGSPLVFWCYCMERRAEIKACCARNNLNLDGQVPRAYLTGELTDISHICNFDWYEWVKFRRIGPKAAYPFPTEHLGRCLGPARNLGNAMSQHVLLENGKVIPIQTLRSLTQAELDSPMEKSKRDAFDKSIKQRYGNDKSPPADWVKRRRKHDDGVQYINEDDEVSKSFGDDEKLEQTTHRIPDNDQYDDFDAYIHAEVLMPQNGDVMQAAKVIGRSTDGEGNPIGQYDPNPMLNTRVYDVMFPDGAIQQYSANLIAESLYENSDEDGFRYQHVDEILDHQKTKDAVDKSDGYVVSKNGQKKHKVTTKGWKFLIRWKDGLQSWVPLSDLKESYPIQLAEYAKL